MPTPFPDPASFLAGFAPGFLAGGLVAALLIRLTRPRPEPAPIQSGGLLAFETRTFRALPVGVDVKPEKPYSVGKDETIITPLLRMILNEFSGGSAIPRTGVPLTWRACRKYGMKRAGWSALCEYVYPGRGYLAPGPGGKRVTVLAAARAREFVARARRAGKVGTPLSGGDVLPEI